jgi:hypothetical protein
MRQKTRKSATREDLLAALKKIHRLCDGLLDGDDLDTTDELTVKKIRYLAGAEIKAI